MVKNTAVEFYISKSLTEAQNKTGLTDGAICFVTSNEGDHYIVLNGEIYGGVTSLSLNKIPVTYDQNDNVTSTLADYFDTNGVLQTKTFKIVKEAVDDNNESYLQAVITANENGIYLGAINDSNKVLSKSQIESLITTASSNITTDFEGRLTTFRTEINNKITGVYRVKGSIARYDLLLLKNVETDHVAVGDVWNVVQEVRTNQVYNNDNILISEDVYPPGTNFVCTSITETQGTTTIEWDALGGTVSFDNYYTKSEVDTKDAATLKSAKDYTDSKLQELTAGVGDLGSLATQIQTNTTNINTLNTRLTWQ